ncbi:MAG: hypothetical protein K2Y23_05705 [Cyanobacteria bacterium]|nr:hypothetical protein [Cyanobacteriota bacterium]
MQRAARARAIDRQPALDARDRRAAAGLAWSLGFLDITIDLAAVWQALDTDVTGRVLSQVQTIAMSAVLLTMALVLWWWAEAATD